MALSLLTYVWQCAPYKAEKLLVLLACADWANERGDCWPSYEQIAQKARTTERGAKLIVHQLLEDGCLKLIQAGGGRGQRNRYRIIKMWKNGEPHSLNSTAEKGEPGCINSEPDSPNEIRCLPKKGERESKKRVNEKARKGERESKNNGTYIELNHHDNHHGKPSSPASASPKPDKTVDPLFEIFASAFLATQASPYLHKKADFVQLASVKQICASNDWPLTPEKFRVAVDHYFASDLGQFTLADLCARFSPFYKSPLDRFGKPLTNGKNGVGALGRSTLEISDAGQSTILAGQNVLRRQGAIK